MHSKNKGKCLHQGILSNDGWWHGAGEDGEMTGGILAVCSECRKELHMSHEEWKNLPLSRKPPLPRNPHPHIPDAILDKDEDYRELIPSVLQEYKEHIRGCDFCKKNTKELLGMDWKEI